jgi:hypothetical protein
LNRLNQQFDLADLRFFLDYCKQQQITVVLVRWPTHPHHHDALKKHELQKRYNKQITKLAKQYGLSYIDLTDITVSDPDKLYADAEDHLNTEGARLYTGLLAERVFALPEVEKALATAPSKEDVAP